SPTSYRTAPPRGVETSRVERRRADASVRTGTSVTPPRGPRRAAPGSAPRAPAGSSTPCTVRRAGRAPLEREPDRLTVGTPDSLSFHYGNRYTTTRLPWA